MVYASLMRETGLIQVDPLDVAKSRRVQRELIDQLEAIDPATAAQALRSWSVEDLAMAGSGLVHFYTRLEETKADVLKALAKVVVALRANFRTEDGVDWGGRSWEYRQTVGAMYAAAGVPPDSQSNIQASLRYHVGNLLREAVPARELEAAGLRTDSPKARMNEARQYAQVVTAAIEGPPRDVGQSAQERAQAVRRQVQAVQTLVGHIAAQAPTLGQRDRKALARDLQTLQDTLTEVLAGLSF